MRTYPRAEDSRTLNLPIKTTAPAPAEGVAPPLPLYGGVHRANSDSPV